MSINQGMTKQTVAYSYNGIWLCNKHDEPRLANAMNGSQYVEKKQDSNESYCMIPSVWKSRNGTTNLW